VSESTRWQKELDVAGQAAKTAGDILRRRFGQVGQIMKKGDIDLVTEADLLAEEAILKTIHSHFPHDTILSEETRQHTEISPRTWIVDPLDGTTNFAHGFPFFAVSIALEVDQEIVIGVVHNPLMNEYFQAAAGMGAYLNRNPIRVSKARELKESLLGTGFPYTIHERYQRVLDHFRKMVLVAQGVRRPGSAAIDLCYVAAGKLDGFWEEDLKPWDTAAGAIMVTEAGGKVSTYAGEPYLPHLKTVVAANPFIHEAMVQILST
jgi:myo-inositol-1(or 4)-monophosphatase